MEILKKKQSVLEKLISLEKNNLEIVRMEYSQLEILLDKSIKKEQSIKDDIAALEEKSRVELQEFNMDTMSKLTQYRNYIDKKSDELIRQSKETNTIQVLFQRVSKELSKLSLKLKKIEEKHKGLMTEIQLEQDKKEIYAADEMWLQRTV